MITKPKGTKDIYGKEGKAWLHVSNIIDNLMEKYNYQYIRTPIFESTELFKRGVGDSTDLVQKETYDFKDRGDRDVTLRPEGTAGVIRSFIENKMYGDATQPVKFYYNGTMYRYERPQAGRYRELTQFGFELIGSNDPITDAEAISIPYNLLKMLGLDGVKVQINSLGDKESRNDYRKALVDYFKPHIDELCDDCKNRLEKNPLRVLDCKVDAGTDLMKKAPKTIDYLNEASKEHYEKVKEYLAILQIEYEETPSLVRGLDYYDHTVFELEASVQGKKMAVGGGGRYNGLVELLGGPSTPAVGYAAGLDRIMLALEEENVEVSVKENVDVYVMYVNEDEKKYAVYLSQELRLNGFVCETEYLSRSLKAQFKQADRLEANFNIILNSEELNNNQVKIKNNKTKEEELIDLDYLIYYLDENIEDECDCEHEDEECNCGHDHHECTCTEECASGHNESCTCSHEDCHCREDN